MRTGADKGHLITVGGRDSRITKVGYYIRKYKLKSACRRELEAQGKLYRRTSAEKEKGNAS